MDRYFRSYRISHNRILGSPFQSIFYGQVLQKRDAITILKQDTTVSIHLLWTGTLEVHLHSFGVRLHRTVSIHLLWTGTLEGQHIIIRLVERKGFNPSFMDRYFRSPFPTFPADISAEFQSIFYGQVLQKVLREGVYILEIEGFNPSFMDRYFRRSGRSNHIPRPQLFQSIFYGQVLQKLDVHGRLNLFHGVSIHLLWTGTLEVDWTGGSGTKPYSFNPSFMDRYFRSLPLGCVQIIATSFQSIFYGQVLQKTSRRAEMVNSSMFQSIFYGQVLQKERTFQSYTPTAVVSIHLLWTGTLEAATGYPSEGSYLCFNPSFMDRYFRSCTIYGLVRTYQPFQSIFYGQVLQKIYTASGLGSTGRFQSIFYGQVLQKADRLSTEAQSFVEFQSIFYGQVLQKMEKLNSYERNSWKFQSIFYGQVLQKISKRAYPNVDIAFQSIFYGQVLQKLRGIRQCQLDIRVSIHLLWTGTLEVRVGSTSFIVPRSFNPSFMDRYFRSWKRNRS